MTDNTMTLVGNLVDDPELRFTLAGAPVARFRVASTPATADSHVRAAASRPERPSSAASAGGGASAGPPLATLAPQAGISALRCLRTNYL